MTNFFTLFFDALRGAVLISGLVVVMMMIIESFNVESDGRMFRSLRKSGFVQVVDRLVRDATKLFGLLGALEKDGSELLRTLDEFLGGDVLRHDASPLAARGGLLRWGEPPLRRFSDAPRKGLK